MTGVQTCALPIWKRQIVFKQNTVSPTIYTHRKEGDDTLSDKQQGMTGFLSTMLRAEARVEDSSDDVSHLLTVVLELIGLLSDALLQGLEKTTLTLRIVGVPGNPDVHKAPARRDGDEEGGSRRIRMTWP